MASTGKKKKADHPSVTAVKDVQPNDLQRVLCEDIGYSTTFLKKERITRLREFAALLLRTLRVNTWAGLVEMDPLVRWASLHTTPYAPPAGAIEYFEVCVLPLIVAPAFTSIGVFAAIE